MRKVYVIIINYKSEDVICNALRSINENNIDLHIVVLDNESTDVSYKRLKAINFRKLEIIRSELNLGYGGGINKVYNYIQKTYNDNDYMFLLNPDAVVSENFIGNLLEILMNNNNAAAVCSRVVTMGNVECFTGSTIDWKHCVIRNDLKIRSFNEDKKIDVFAGCAALLDSRKFNEVGMFDDELFVYYDEPFLSMKFHDKGFDILYEPNLTVYHHRGHSIHKPLKNYYLRRNHIYFFKKFKKNYCSFFCEYRSPIRQIIFHIIHFSPQNIYFIILAIWHAVIGKQGRL